MIHDIITGIPRSGTTLVARIVAAARPTAMLLGEPPEMEAALDWPRGEFAQRLHAWLGERLARARRDGSYEDRRLPDLGVPDNYYGADSAAVAFRRVPVTPGGFSGAICKHNAFFIPLAQEIAAHPGLRLLRVVRHPRGAVASWRRRDLPVRAGRMPHLEMRLPALARRLDAAANCAERQAILYGDMLRALAAPGHTRESGLLRYEDLVRGAALPPPHEQISTAPFAKPATAALLAPQESAAFTETLHRVDAPAAALLRGLYP